MKLKAELELLIFLQVTNHTTNEYFLSKGKEKYWYAHGFDKHLMQCIWYCSAKKVWSLVKWYNNFKCRLSQANYCKQKENCDADEDDDDGDISSDEEALENAETKHHIEEVHVRKNKITGFVGELLSYTPLAVVRKTRAQNQIFPSTISRCLIGGLRKIKRIVCFGRRQQYPTWRQY